MNIKNLNLLAVFPLGEVVSFDQLNAGQEYLGLKRTTEVKGLQFGFHDLELLAKIIAAAVTLTGAEAVILPTDHAENKNLRRALLAATQIPLIYYTVPPEKRSGSPPAWILQHTPCVIQPNGGSIVRRLYKKRRKPAKRRRKHTLKK